MASAGEGGPTSMDGDGGTVLLDRQDGQLAILVGGDAYVQFCRRVDVGLRMLVARWQHTAAPNAARPQRRGDWGRTSGQ
jgi:hypothetical protein